jgi:hypothetical protein
MHGHGMAWLPSLPVNLQALLLLMIETRNPNRDDKNRHAKHTELPKLVAAKQAKNWQIGKWEKACA